MTPERWRQVDALLQAALEQVLAERIAFIFSDHKEARGLPFRWLAPCPFVMESYELCCAALALARADGDEMECAFARRADRVTTFTAQDDVGKISEYASGHCHCAASGSVQMGSDGYGRSR